jgi:Reverse transcriptase (RNA-dependent DNA polymerase)
MTEQTGATFGGTAFAAHNHTRHTSLHTSHYIWGDNIAHREKKTVRILGANWAGLSVHPKGDKMRRIKGTLDRTKTDILGIMEVDLMWKLLPSDSQIAARTHGWFESFQHMTAYYKALETQRRSIFGGVSQWTMNKTVHRIIGGGEDPTGLGRWSWQRYRGKDNVALRVVTAYRPSNSREGPLTVWNQHRAFFDNQNRDGDPREFFTTDLLDAIKEWTSLGDQLVIMVDANEHVEKSDFGRKMKEAGLIDIVTSRHPKGPATYLGGSDPIDGIFVTATLQNCRCGYVNVESDHFGMWIDIPYRIAWGQDDFTIVKPQARRLKSDDPRTADLYIQELERQCLNTQIVDRSEALLQTIQQRQPLEPNQQTLWETIDSELMQLMSQAEEKCRKFKMGAVQWTPTFSKLRLDIKVICLMLNSIETRAKKRKKKASGRYIQRLQDMSSLREVRQWDKAELEAKLKLLKAQMRRYKQNSFQERSTWLEGKADALARKAVGTIEEDVEEFDAQLYVKREKILRNLKRIEQQRRSARIIKQVNGKLQTRQALTQVEGYDREGRHVIAQEKDLIEELLLDENITRFTQSGTTPALVEPLSRALGALGLTELGESILRGDFQHLAGLDDCTIRLLRQLARPAETEDMSMDLDVEDFGRGWRRSKERTSSGPFGAHFGHYKAAAQSPILTRLHAIMAWIPFVTGYSPQRWQHGIQVMIPKKANNLWAHLLRTILLFAADYNFNNKRLGRAMMKGAEKQGLIAIEQYGSRKALSAIDHCVNKRLTFDLLRQQRVPGVLCSNDAKGCYDRIAHSIAALCMRRMGVPKEPIISMFSTLQNMKHYVRTAFGDSTKHFQAARVHPVAIQGIGQGNGAGPQIWAVVSTAILNCLREAGAGATFLTPLTQEELKFVGYAFVDDTDLLITGDNEAHGGDWTINAMQHSLKEWEGALRATGGALEPAKTFWYSVDFKWTNGEWEYCKCADTPGSLKVRNPAGEIQQIERVEAHEARRTLGAWLAPDGNNEAQHTYLMEQAELWAERVRTGHLDKRFVWQSLTTTVMAKISYPLAATTMSEQECDDIDRIVLRTALPHSGVLPTFPRALVFGSISKQGLGFRRIFDRQGIAGLGQFLRHIGDYKSMTGKLLRASLEYAQIELGIPQLLFSTETAALGHLLTDSFIRHLWHYCDHRGISIRGPVARIELKREGDQYIIPACLENASPDELAIVNKCRLFLQVTTLAEICDNSGNRIAEWAWKGDRNQVQQGWPVQGRPPKQMWTTWQRILRLTFGDGRGLQERGQGYILREKLRDWFTTERSDWEYCASTDTLYNVTARERYQKVPGYTSRSRKGTYERTAGEVNIPPQTERAEVSLIAQTAILKSHARRVPRPQQPKNNLWLDMTVWSEGDEAALARDILIGKAVAVSDGSFKDGFGTASAVIISTSGKQRVDVVTPGVQQDQCSYRSELAGLVAAIHHTNELCKRHGIQNGTITLACDGEAALRSLEDFDNEPSMNRQHFDLIGAGRKALRDSTIIWKFHHVHGHQSGDNLDMFAILNNEMDAACKQHWQEQVTRTEACQTLSSDEWSCWLKDRKITSRLKETLFEWCMDNSAMEYWNYRIGEEETDGIDWEVTAKMMKLLQPARRQWISKQSSGMFASGKMMKNRDSRLSAACARCGQFEDSEHILRCRAATTNELWKRKMTELETLMQKLKTCPSVRTDMIQGLTNWRQNDQENTHDDTTHQSQQQVGWRNLLEGRPAMEWRRRQQKYWELLGHRSGSVRRWLTQILLKLVSIAWDLWDHRNGILHAKDCKLLSDKIDQEI